MEDTEGKNRCHFSKGYTNLVQNPAELGNMWTGELEFHGWNVRFLRLHLMNVNHTQYIWLILWETNG